MSIKSISDIQEEAQDAAASTVAGAPVSNPYCADTHPAHADAWNEAYESAMREMGCFA